MHILIVDDEAGLRNSLFQLLKDGHDVTCCENGAVALQVLEKTAVDLVITDNQMPELTGLELIHKGKQLAPSTAFILMTAYGSVEQAVEAIRGGAEDYFMKPFDFSEIEHRVRRIEELRAWRAVRLLKGESGQGVSRLTGVSASIQAAREFVKKVASVASPVLILGPSGSGKEVLARAIHETGTRSNRPFIAINCASLTEQLLESELFGHEKGAFTGATAAKPGKFELAKGGTIFLDEIGEMSPTLQARLLRVLQEKEFYRVGGVRQIKSDARVICATHRPLKEMVQQGAFREDLFFRLNVLTLTMASLKERQEDIPALIGFFWQKLSAEMGRKPELAPATVELLMKYPYPGNIRELQNVLERLMVLGPPEGVIEPSALPPEFHTSASFGNEPLPNLGLGIPAPGESTLPAALAALEIRMISNAMESAKGNQVRAAELLGISRGALQHKLKKYGISDETESPTRS